MDGQVSKKEDKWNKKGSGSKNNTCEASKQNSNTEYLLNR